MPAGGSAKILSSNPHTPRPLNWQSFSPYWTGVKISQPFYRSAPFFFWLSTLDERFGSASLLLAVPAAGLQYVVEIRASFRAAADKTTVPAFDFLFLLSVTYFWRKQVDGRRLQPIASCFWQWYTVAKQMSQTACRENKVEGDAGTGCVASTGLCTKQSMKIINYFSVWREIVCNMFGQKTVI